MRGRTSSCGGNGGRMRKVRAGLPYPSFNAADVSAVPAAWRYSPRSGALSDYI